jgi:hypothetical protein
MKTVADILAESREYLEEHGWTSGTLVDDDGRVCTLGAVVFSQQWENGNDMHAEHTGDARVMMRALLDTSLTGLYRDNDKDPVSLVVAWNDDEGRTEQEVLDAFAKAEKITRAGFDPDA